MVTDSNCRECGSLLVRYEWNSVTDIVVCDNYRCQLSHVPVSGIAPKANKATKSGSEQDKRRPKMPEWIRGLHNPEENSSSKSNFLTRLDRLKHYIYTEDERKD